MDCSCSALLGAEEKSNAVIVIKIIRDRWGLYPSSGARLLISLPLAMVIYLRRRLLRLRRPLWLLTQASDAIRPQIRRSPTPMVA